LSALAGGNHERPSLWAIDFAFEADEQGLFLGRSKLLLATDQSSPGYPNDWL
jgi:hypothetical protein